MTELWKEFEMWLDGIEDIVKNRCYPKGSTQGARHILEMVQEHATWAEEALVKLEAKEVKVT